MKKSKILKTENDFDYTIKKNWRIILSGLFTGSYSFFNYFVLAAVLNRSELVTVHLYSAIWSIFFYISISMGSAIFYDKGDKLNLNGMPLINNIVILIAIITFAFTKSYLLLFAILTYPLSLYINICIERLSRNKYKYIYILASFEVFICMLVNFLSLTYLKGIIDIYTVYFSNYFFVILFILMPMYRFTSKISLKEFFIINVSHGERNSFLIKMRRLKLLFMRARPKIIQIVFIQFASIFVLKNNDKVSGNGLAIVMLTNIYKIVDSTIADVAYFLKKNIVNSKGDLNVQFGYFKLVNIIGIFQGVVYLGIIFLNNIYGSYYDFNYLVIGSISLVILFYLYNYIIVPNTFYLIKHQKFNIPAATSIIEISIIFLASVLIQDILIVLLFKVLAGFVNALILKYYYNKGFNKRSLTAVCAI